MHGIAAAPCAGVPALCVFHLEVSSRAPVFTLLPTHGLIALAADLDAGATNLGCGLGDALRQLGSANVLLSSRTTVLAPDSDLPSSGPRDLTVHPKAFRRMMQTTAFERFKLE